LLTGGRPGNAAQLLCLVCTAGRAWALAATAALEKVAAVFASPGGCRLLRGARVVGEAFRVLLAFLGARPVMLLLFFAGTAPGRAPALPAGGGGLVWMILLAVAGGLLPAGLLPLKMRLMTDDGGGWRGVCLAAVPAELHSMLQVASNSCRGRAAGGVWMLAAVIGEWRG
jgi:hypothetical protein